MVCWIEKKNKALNKNSKSDNYKRLLLLILSDTINNNWNKTLKNKNKISFCFSISQSKKKLSQNMI